MTLPYIAYIGMCHCEGLSFQTLGCEIGYRNKEFWSRIGYNLQVNQSRLINFSLQFFGNAFQNSLSSGPVYIYSISWPMIIMKLLKIVVSDWIRVILVSNLECKMHPNMVLYKLRASSYEPGQPGWLSFQDLA